VCVAAQIQVVLMTPSHKDTPSTQLTVLVVEDNPQFRQLISDFLTFAGYAVISAMNAIEALTILHQADPIPNLIITDIKMIPMDGCEFLREVRNQWKKIPVIMMSTSASFETSCPDISLKPEAYMIKPFSYEELIRVIQAILMAGKGN
jgi:two-component system OmpR family response regulator